LDEVTVKDMLEGDNMYTCSKCQRKVRAEKRSVFSFHSELNLLVVSGEKCPGLTLVVADACGMDTTCFLGFK
jgi:ubiquitin C-terminal hydrolase